MNAVPDKELALTAGELRELLDYDPAIGVFRWRLFRNSGARSGQEAGTVDPKGYIRIKINGVQYMAHRLAWLAARGTWPTGEVDHINSVKGDNRISNLRVATKNQNQHNRKINARHGVGLKGVRVRGDRYEARIAVDGKQLRLGAFDTPEDAHAAYCAAARRYHGAFANDGNINLER